MGDRNLLKMFDDIYKAIGDYERKHGTVRYIWCNPKMHFNVMCHDMSKGCSVVPVPELPFREIVFSHYDIMKGETA